MENKIRDLIVKAPFLCDCREADRVSLIFGATYDATTGNGNAFDPIEADFQSPRHRLKFIDLTHPFWEAKKRDVAKKIMALLATCMWAAWGKKGKVSVEKSKEMIEESYIDTQIKAPEVDAILTQEEALAVWWWI